MRRRNILALTALLPVLAAAPPAVAQSAETVVRAALARWTTDFNARNAAAVCDLFAPDLRYDYRGFPERDYRAICDLLQSSLADRSKTYTYALDIKEIMVSGDLAVVRLVWTLTVATPGVAGTVKAEEPGMDVFRKQPDGSWKIVRYIAYEAP